jgi:hypothetical protein
MSELSTAFFQPAKVDPTTATERVFELPRQEIASIPRRHFACAVDAGLVRAGPTIARAMPVLPLVHSRRMESQHCKHRAGLLSS